AGYNAASGFQGVGGVLNVKEVDPTSFGQHAEHHEPIAWLAMFTSIAVAGAGIGLAYMIHLQDRRRAEEIARRVPNLTRAIEHKYWVDEIYQAMIVEPLRALGRLFFTIDRYVVDGTVGFVIFVPQAGVRV